MKKLSVLICALLFSFSFKEVKGEGFLFRQTDYPVISNADIMTNDVEFSGFPRRTLTLQTASDIIEIKIMVASEERPVEALILNERHLITAPLTELSIGEESFCASPSLMCFRRGDIVCRVVGKTRAYVEGDFKSDPGASISVEELAEALDREVERQSKINREPLKITRCQPVKASITPGKLEVSKTDIDVEVEDPLGQEVSLFGESDLVGVAYSGERLSVQCSAGNKGGKVEVLVIAVNEALQTATTKCSINVKEPEKPEKPEPLALSEGEVSALIKELQGRKISSLQLTELFRARNDLKLKGDPIPSLEMEKPSTNVLSRDAKNSLVKEGRDLGLGGEALKDFVNGKLKELKEDL